MTVIFYPLLRNLKQQLKAKVFLFKLLQLTNQVNTSQMHIKSNLGNKRR